MPWAKPAADITSVRTNTRIAIFINFFLQFQKISAFKFANRVHEKSKYATIIAAPYAFPEFTGFSHPRCGNLHIVEIHCASVPAQNTNSWRQAGLATFFSCIQALFHADLKQNAKVRPVLEPRPKQDSPVPKYRPASSRLKTGYFPVVFLMQKQKQPRERLAPLQTLYRIRSRFAYSADRQKRRSAKKYRPKPPGRFHFFPSASSCGCW